MAALPVQLGLFGDAATEAAQVPPPPPLPVRPPEAGVVHGLQHHPQANQRTVLEGQPLAYVLRRSVRKSIGFAISAAGLTVTAPRWATGGMVETALQSKARWVLRKLQQFQQHQALPTQRVEWGEGAELTWRGEAVVVRLGAPSQHTPSKQAGERVVLDVEDRTLWVGLAQSAGPAQVRDAVQAWMQQQALAHFQARLAHFAPLLDVRWTALRLSSATTRWGSAKADGSIRLHWRLMQFAPEVLDYVVVHELAHLRHMDHSPRFWQTVGRILPDYASLRARLRGERLPAW
jgi:predicted metal-dependent hydrolase